MTLGLNGVAIVVVLIAQWMLEKGIVLDQVSVAIILGSSMMVWGLAIPVFLLARAASWLEWTMGWAIARAAEARRAERPGPGDLWDRWIDETPDLFR